MTPKQAYYKATRDLGERIPELELELELKLKLVINEDAKYSYYYARDIIKGRWEKGELDISKDAYYSYCYAIEVIKGRWELGEAAISKDARYSSHYAKHVIKGRLPDFMHNQMILDNNEYAKDYIEFVDI